jgi:hypothetical protein
MNSKKLIKKLTFFIFLLGTTSTIVRNWQIDSLTPDVGTLWRKRRAGASSGSCYGVEDTSG